MPKCTMTASGAHPRNIGKTSIRFFAANIAFFTFFVFALIPASPREALCAQVTLAWDPLSAPSPAGYKLYYGSASRSYSFAVDAATQTMYTVTNLNEGATYYFAATAYDASGVESNYSDEVVYSVPSSCSYAIAPTGASFTATAGTGSVTVTAPSTCSWNVGNPASWITIASGASGRGNGTVSYSVSANAGASSRAAGLTIGGSVFTVTQAGTSTYLITASAGANGSIRPNGQVTVARGASQTFTITPVDGYQVGALSVDGAAMGPATSYTFTNVTASHTISAIFSAVSATYSLTITKTGTGTGTVSTEPAGTSFSAGTKVTLTAIPGRASAFVGWSGACSGTSPTCTITMNSNAGVTASFRKGSGH